MVTALLGFTSKTPGNMLTGTCYPLGLASWEKEAGLVCWRHYYSLLFITGWFISKKHDVLWVLCSSQVQAQRKEQHRFPLPEEKTKRHAGSLWLPSRGGTRGSAEGRPPQSSPGPFPRTAVGIRGKRGVTGTISITALLPAATGATREGSKGHSAATLPGLLKTSLSWREDLTVE